MKGVLIFNNVNDLIFSKWDNEFIQRMNGFRDHDSDPNITEIHSVAQLLSPIITSQKVMGAQFGNTYSSMQCKDGTNVAFDEWLDHVLMIVSDDDIDDIYRELMDTKTFMQHICGQNTNLLHSSLYQDWLSVLLENRTKGEHIPGVSGIIGESGATAAALVALKTAAKDIKSSTFHHYHLIIFVGNKMLALYSSRGSEDLTPSDLLLLNIQSVAAQEYWAEIEKETSDKDDVDSKNRIPWLSEENSAIVYLCAGGATYPAVPHATYFAQIASRITFIVVLDMELREIGNSMQISTQILSNVRKLLLQRNFETLPATMDSLEAALKKTTDVLRKNKSNSNLCTRISSHLADLRKAINIPSTADVAAAALQSALLPVLQLLRPNIPSLNSPAPLRDLRNKIAPFIDFLKVKAMRYFGLESDLEVDTSCSLTRHKYVEEFPGLIHFIYIDRLTGRYLAPDMADCADMLTPEMLRGCVSRYLRMVREGYVAATWRAGSSASGAGGGALHACAVLWWESADGTAVSPRPLHPAAVRALPHPGDILSVFYKQLGELAFAPRGGRAVRELLCVHLGLVPAATAVAQARRLAHALRDLAPGLPDLL